MYLAGRVDSGALPLDGWILSDLLRSDVFDTVKSGATHGAVTFGVGQGMKPCVTPNSPDQYRLLWQLLEDGPVGVTAVDSGPKRTFLLSVMQHLAAQLAETLDPLLGKRLSSAIPPVSCSLLRGRVLVGFARGWSMDEVDRDRTARPAVLIWRQDSRHLNKPSAPHEVGVKGRAHRVSAPRGSWDLAPLLPTDRVIHRNDQRPIRIEVVEDLPANRIEKTAGVTSLL